MAGRRSPWGGGDNGGDGGREGPSGGDTPGGDAPSGPEGASPPPPPKGPRNPWVPPGEQPPRRSASIEDIFRQREQRRGGGGGSGGNGGFPRLPPRPDGKSWFPFVLGGIALVWIAATSTHMVGPKEEGIVTTFGKYDRTIAPGVSMTLPWPIQSVSVTDVTSIKRDSIPEGEAEKLMLTSDQNLVDLSYLVRWNIKDLKLYTFQLAEPGQAVREVAEAAMRASIAEVNLNDAMGGAGRARVEQNMRTRMQGILDAYKSGVRILGVEIKKADPPAKVIGAFQQVTAAQQDAQRDLSNAQAWAQQLLARAQGDAASFDKVYGEYRLAPDVTKRRMYYETMERVLSNNDKIVVEADGVTPYLPLPELRKKAAAAAATAAPAQGGQ
ncbi:MAG: protease modulator HflK [Novosphingobium sp.]|nr:protease modulator HflK [Novosphingobium sp.]